MLRREFIKSLGFTVSGIFLAALPDKIFGNGNMPLVCSYCGARVARWNVYGTGKEKGIFCPNCGINIRRGTFTFRRLSGKSISKIKKKENCSAGMGMRLGAFPKSISGSADRQAKDKIGEYQILEGRRML